MPRMVEFALSWETLKSGIKGGVPVITSGKAHAFMAKFRAEASGPVDDQGIVSVTAESQDLTKLRSSFDWWSYIVFHPEGREIVGEGVISFGMQFVDAIDGNYRQRRLDFVVHRVGNPPYVRLHAHTRPLKKKHGPPRKEAQPIYGKLEDWVGHKVPFSGIGGAPSSADAARLGAAPSLFIAHRPSCSGTCRAHRAVRPSC